MIDLKKKLTDLVDSFLKNQIDAESFEKEFSDIYDLKESESNLTERETKYFDTVRLFLERYTSNETDLKTTDYYINDTQLKEKIIKLQQEILI